MKIGKDLLKSKALWPAGIIATLLMLYTFMEGFGSAVDQRLITAPLNPAYLEYMENLRTGNLVTTTEKGYPLGAIPPLFVLPPESEGTLPNFPPVSYQPYFDLRAVNGLTGIRDQGACGSCWTFATFASLESYLKFKKGLTKDFSEWHLAKNHLWDNSPCDGGNHHMSTAYLSRWEGPRNESELPYPYNVPVQATTFHVQKVWWLPGRANFTDNNTIKGALKTIGAVYMAFYWVDAYFNSTNNCYYNGVDTSENHAVAIVGWDDSYPRTNFTEPLPPDNGAFIVRNSWGTSWGENGYFYISYYDNSLKAYAQFHNAEALNSYKSQYSHDPLGCNSFVGYLINHEGYQSFQI